MNGKNIITVNDSDVKLENLITAEHKNRQKEKKKELLFYFNAIHSIISSIQGMFRNNWGSFFLYGGLILPYKILKVTQDDPDINAMQKIFKSSKYLTLFM